VPLHMLVLFSPRGLDVLFRESATLEPAESSPWPTNLAPRSLVLRCSTTFTIYSPRP
jgi:hypothetical protein